MSSQQYEIHNILKRARTLDISRQFSPYSGVEILTGLQDDDGNDVIYYAPSNPTERNSGRVLTIENPWGTQAQANAILTQIKGFAYQPYEATDAFVDPSAEIGDGVSVKDVYSGIYSLSRRYSALMPADVSAPQSEEIDHEYPYESMADRSIERRFSAVESEFRIQSGEIAAKVSVEGGESQSVSWKLTASDWSVYANGTRVFRITPTGAEVSGKLTATSGKIGGFTITSSSIYKDTSSLTSSTKGVYVGTDGIRINGSNSAYFKADKNGNIEANKLKLTGTLTIGSATITADNLRNGANSGRAYGTATGSANPSSYPDYFTTKYLYTKYGITAEGTTTIKGDLFVQGGANGQYLCKWKTIIVSGVKYVALCQAP